MFLGNHAPRSPGARRTGWALALWALLPLGTSGCVRHVTMSQVAGDDLQTPHTKVLYAGVRDASRRYASYEVVDETILIEDGD